MAKEEDKDSNEKAADVTQNDVKSKIDEHEKVLQELTDQAQKLNSQLMTVMELRKQRIGAIAGLRDLIGVKDAK